MVILSCWICVSTTSQNSDGQKNETKRWLKGPGHTIKDVRWFEDKKRQAADIAAAKGIYQSNGDRRRGHREAKGKALKLHEKSYSPTAIGRECDIARSTVYTYLNQQE